MIRLLKSFVNDESGAGAMEYGLIAAVLAGAIAAAITNLGVEITNTFGRTTGPLQSAGAGSAADE